MATIDSLTLKAVPLGTDTIELNDGKKGTIASLPIGTATQTALDLKANSAALGTAASRDVGQEAGNVLEFVLAGNAVPVAKSTNATDARTSISKYDLSRPFATIQAAINAASSGDTVRVAAGIYAEQLTLKDGVFVLCEAGVNIDWPSSSFGNTVSISGTSAVATGIFGYPMITRSGSGLGGDNACIAFTNSHASSTVYVQAISISHIGPINQNSAAIFVSANGKIYVDCLGDITSATYDAIVSQGIAGAIFSVRATGMIAGSVSSGYEAGIEKSGEGLTFVWCAQLGTTGTAEAYDVIGGTLYLDALRIVGVGSVGEGASIVRNALTSDLTTINASNLTSGTVALARLPTVTVPFGGTGATTLTANGVLLGNGTAAVQSVAAGTSGNVLTSNGTTWQSSAPSGGSVTISDTPPVSPAEGDRWFDSDTGAIYVRYGTEWVETSGSSVPVLVTGIAGLGTGVSAALSIAPDALGGLATRRRALIAATNQFTYRVMGTSLNSATSSGSGTAVSSDSAGNLRLTSGTAAGARNQMPTGSFVFGVWNGNYNAADWGLPMSASGLINIFHSSTPASDTRIRAGIGKSVGALGQITARGFMIEIQWNGSAYEVFVAVHNGTTLNIQTTGITFATQRGILWSVESDGAGNAVWYISAGGSGTPYNGHSRTTATLTQTGAPTGTEGTTRYPFAEINNGAAGGASLTIDFNPMTFAFGG